MEAALEHFNINVTGMTCLDAGLSTGGFTDCLLQKGADKVYGVDVGFGQVIVFCNCSAFSVCEFAARTYHMIVNMQWRHPAVLSQTLLHDSQPTLTLGSSKVRS